MKDFIGMGARVKGLDKCFDLTNMKSDKYEIGQIRNRTNMKSDKYEIRKICNRTNMKSDKYGIGQKCDLTKG